MVMENSTASVPIMVTKAQALSTAQMCWFGASPIWYGLAAPSPAHLGAPALACERHV